MSTDHLTQRKEVTALDADVPLPHTSLIRFNLSELRLFRHEAKRLKARHRVGLYAA